MPSNKNPTKESNNPNCSDELKKKIWSFKLIHDILLASQRVVNSIFNRNSTNFLGDKEIIKLSDNQLVEAIATHIKKHPDGRTAQAWSLAEKYVNSFSPDNVDLVNDIFKAIYFNTRNYLGFRYSSLWKAPTFTKEEVNHHNYVTSADRISYMFGYIVEQGLKAGLEGYDDHNPFTIYKDGVLVTPKYLGSLIPRVI